MYKKIVLILFLALLPIASASTTVYNPTSINPSYDSGYDKLMYVNNNDTTGHVTSTDLTTGYLYPSNDRITGGIKVLDCVQDHTEVGTYYTRIFCNDENGNLFYTDNSISNMTNGFWSPLNPGGQLNQVATLSATIRPRRIAIDSNGDVYTHDLLVVKKYDKSNDYASSTFVTITPGTHYTVASGGGGSPVITADIIDIKVDSSDNVHFLIGSSVSTYSSTGYGYLNHTILTSDGTLVSTELLQSVSSANSGLGLTGYMMGGLVLDVTNPTNNFTYAFRRDTADSSTDNAYIYHNSTTGTYDIGGGALTGITATSGNYIGIAYADSKIYIYSKNDNLVTYYSSFFVGYNPVGSGSSQTPLLTYDNYYANFDSDTYGNNSVIGVSYYGKVVLSDNLFSPGIETDYDYIIILKNPSSETLKTIHASLVSNGALCDYLSVGCEYSFSGSYNIVPGTVWDNGTYTLNLYERYGGNSLLIYQDTAVVLNTSTNNTNPYTDIGLDDPQSIIGLSRIDGIVSLLGMGISPVSKFIFALIVIIFITLYSWHFTQQPGLATVFALCLIGFFTWLSFIPIWLIVVCVLAVVAKFWGDQQ